MGSLDLKAAFPKHTYQFFVMEHVNKEVLPRSRALTQRAINKFLLDKIGEGWVKQFLTVHWRQQFNNFWNLSKTRYHKNFIEAGFSEEKTERQLELLRAQFFRLVETDIRFFELPEISEISTDGTTLLGQVLNMCILEPKKIASLPDEWWNMIDLANSELPTRAITRTYTYQHWLYESVFAEVNDKSKIKFAVDIPENFKTHAIVTMLATATDNELKRREEKERTKEAKQTASASSTPTKTASASSTPTKTASASSTPTKTASGKK
jgi:hypothetical protein